MLKLTDGLGVAVVKLMLIYIVLAALPGIGFMDTKTAFRKAVPWETVFCSINYMMGIFAMPFMMLNYRYGYWEKGALTRTGTLIMLSAVVIMII